MTDLTLTNFLDNQSAEEDWTFAGADTRYMSHGFHTYPARMIPQVARSLIKSYSKAKNDVCIDPFCGSGTVLVESKLHEIESIGIDANPLAILLAKVKTTPLEHKVLQKYQDSLKKSLAASFSKDVELPQIRNRDFWFKPSVSRDLTKIRNLLLEIENQGVQDFFKVCFSITVRKVSNNRPGEFKLYRRAQSDLEKFNPDVFGVFNQIVSKNIKAMDSFASSITKNVPVTIVKGDSRSLLTLKPDKIHENSATLLVTSPPYGDSHTTVAYGQYSRYLSLWLGFDEDEVMGVDRIGLGGRMFKDRKDIGSSLLEEVLDKIADIEESAGRKPIRARETYAFFKDLDTCFEQFSKIMRQGRSHICFVLGNRSVKRIRVPADQILIELGKKYGFKHIVTKHREIPNKHQPSENAPENQTSQKGETMTKENIVIWNY